MKKEKITALVIFLFLNGSINAQQFIVNFDIPKSYDQAKVRLRFDGNVDTMYFQNGSYHFAGNVDNVVEAVCDVDFDGSGTYSNYYHFLLCSGTTNLTVTDIDSLDKFSVSGNQYALDYHYKLSMPINAESIVINNLKVLNMQRNDPKLQKQINEELVKCFDIPKKYIKLHPSSPVSLFALKMMRDGNKNGGYPVLVPELDSLFHSLAPEIKNSQNGKSYAQSLEKWKLRDLSTPKG